MTNQTRATSWDHTSLSVTDLDGAIRFYESAFGYRVVFEARGLTSQAASITGIPGTAFDLAHLVSPLSPHRLELIQFSAPGSEGSASTSGTAPTVPDSAGSGSPPGGAPTAPDSPGSAGTSGTAPTAPGAGHLSFVVEDLEHAIATVQALGARQLGSVTSFAEGRAVYFVEPSGTVIELEEGSAAELGTS